ncbi:MAG: hypothetical protein V3V19_00350 [Cocleimonas sp.]
MKKANITLISMTCCIAFLSACNGNDSQNTSSLAGLNSALGIASNTMTSMDKTTSADSATVNKDNVMESFSKKYASNLNNEPSLASYGPMGVTAEKDGSFKTFSDTNKNNIKDAGEKDLFKVEADAENNRLVASNEEGVAEQSHSFMGSGFFMGMLLGNMLGGQRSMGVNPARRKATPKRSSVFNKSKSSPSARSRAGSGSHASGK